MSKKPKNQGLIVGDPDKVDALDRAMAYDLIANPRAKAAVLGPKYGMSVSAAAARIRDPNFTAFMMKVELSVFEGVMAARKIAMSNTFKYLKAHKTAAGLEMTKMLMKPISEHPGAMPVPDTDAPEFYEPVEKEED